jgi:hypothetical protein
MGRAEKTEDNRGQIISRFETLRDEFKKKHPGATRSLLRLTKVHLHEFTLCSGEVWQALNWPARQDEIAPLIFGSRVYQIRALKSIFKPHGVADIKVVPKGEMELVPIEEEN